ncbi:hypothetical protein RQP46_004823 [Phenoliferia psychrophenolica]
MPFGQLVIGPPGSGKSTYCYGVLQASLPFTQFLTALKRPVIIVNLDPAAPAPPYPSSISITSLISLSDAMDAYSLGPNGGMLYCLEYLEKNLGWLEAELERAMTEMGWVGDRREEAYVVFDTPGQVELSTDHGSLRRIVDSLAKKGGWRLAAVHLMDAHHITDASKYVALLLLSLRTMLQMELPHVNVLSKIDLLQAAGDLPFNLDYYTEVQDLQQLVPLLEADPRTRKFSELNRVVCELVEDFGLVSFETLCVEDKDSMLHLVRIIDQALGYVAPTPSDSSSSSHDHSDPSHSHASAHAHHHASQTMPAPTGPLSNLYHTSTVQEKWVDYPKEYAEFEREGWKKEGEIALDRANEESAKGLKKAPPDSSPKKVVKPGRPKTRNGKVVGLLRKKYQPDESKVVALLNLAPSSTGAQIASHELSSSLSYHLVKLSSGVLTTPNSPPILNLTDTWTSQRLLRRRVLLASLAALGSRRSFHSGVLGSTPTATFPTTNCIGDIVVQRYGEKRESACRSLVQRAVDLAEEGKLLKDHSPLAQEVVAVLRVALFAVSPRHPFSSQLAEYFHENVRRRHSAEGSATISDDLGLSICEYDAYTSILLNKPPKISEAELSTLYGWNSGLIPAALDRLCLAATRGQPDQTLQGPCRIVTIGLLRGIIQIQAQERTNSRDFTKLGRDFTCLWDYLTVMEESVAALHGNEGDRRTIAPHLGATPMFMESLLAAQAARLCAGSSVPIAQDILELSELRFLRWLKQFTIFLDDRQFFTGPEANHTRALLLSILDLFPSWVELTVEAATQAATGAGPLACADFTWVNLATLHGSLKFAAAVYARSGRQEAKLADAFKTFGIDSETVNPPRLF